MFHFLCFENKCVWQFEAFILGPSNWILDIDIEVLWASAQIGQLGKHCINQYVRGGWRKMRSCRAHSHLTVSLSTSMWPLPHFTPQESFEWPFTITQLLFNTHIQIESLMFQCSMSLSRTQVVCMQFTVGVSAHEYKDCSVNVRLFFSCDGFN